MTAPGWYHGDGDPPGTQRYWDGRSWIGDPVYEPTAPPAAQSPPAPGGGGYSYGHYPMPARSTYPGGLKAVGVALSVIKAIPLAFGFLIAFWLFAASASIDDEVGDWYGLGELFGAAAAVLFIFLLLGGLLLGFQFVGSLREKPMMVFVPAAIMAAWDGLLTVGSWASVIEDQGSSAGNGSTGAAIMTAVAAAQIYVAVQAFRSR